MIKFDSIPKFPTANYAVDVSWKDLERWLGQYNTDHIKIELNPDFQRGHVWSQEQKTKYLEYVMRGGESGKNVYFNHPNWMGSFKGTLQCVDGLQRITAIREFMRDDVLAFGHKASEFDTLWSLNLSLKIRIGTLKTRKEVLEWYLAFNDGGTQHSNEELDRVRGLINEC